MSLLRLVKVCSHSSVQHCTVHLLLNCCSALPWSTQSRPNLEIWVKMSCSTLLFNIFHEKTYLLRILLSFVEGYTLLVNTYTFPLSSPGEDQLWQSTFLTNTYTSLIMHSKSNEQELICRIIGQLDYVDDMAALCKKGSM